MAARDIAVNMQMWYPEFLEPTFSWHKTSNQPLFSRIDAMK